MKNLKIRVWDGYNKEMIYPDGVVRNKYGIYIPYVLNEKKEIQECNILHLKCKRQNKLPIMLCTDYKDSNKNELWEGDIVESDVGYKYQVVYYKEWTSFVLQDLKEKDVIVHFVFNDTYYHPDKITKIGNIFENKDIIKQYDPNKIY
jgi:uncharacterized phage protein (TIGR01671 family)